MPALIAPGGLSHISWARGWVSCSAPAITPRTLPTRCGENDPLVLNFPSFTPQHHRVGERVRACACMDHTQLFSKPWPSVPHELLRASASPLLPSRLLVPTPQRDGRVCSLSAARTHVHMRVPHVCTLGGCGGPT